MSTGFENKKSKTKTSFAASVDSYNNLQLLHGHCHDAKTVADIVAVSVQEIDEDYLNCNPF